MTQWDWDECELLICVFSTDRLTGEHPSSSLSSVCVVSSSQNSTWTENGSSGRLPGLFCSEHILTEHKALRGDLTELFLFESTWIKLSYKLSARLKRLPSNCSVWNFLELSFSFRKSVYTNWFVRKEIHLYKQMLDILRLVLGSDSFVWKNIKQRRVRFTDNKEQHKSSSDVSGRNLRVIL